MPTTAVRSGGVRRMAGALAAGTLLALLVAGLPVALVRLAGNPLPDDLPAVEGILSALTTPDDGTLFLALLTAVGWLAWAAFTCSVVVEVVARVAGRRTPAIPGLAGPQRLVSALVAAVAALPVSATLTGDDATFVDPPPPLTTTASAQARTDDSTAHPAGVRDASTLHVVVRGEGLLDLQDRYGVPWQRIAEANYGVRQPDGQALERGQVRIYPGWRLRIPDAGAAGRLGGPGTAAADVAAGTESGAGGSAPADPAKARGGTEAPLRYEVVEDDWMWHIAERFLGDPQRYPDIAERNPQYADRHADYPDHIEPGWVLTLPPDAVDRGETAHATGGAVVDTAATPAGGSGEDIPVEPPPAEPPPAPPAPPADVAPAPTPPVDPAPIPSADPSPSGTAGATPAPPTDVAALSPADPALAPPADPTPARTAGAAPASPAGHPTPPVDRTTPPGPGESAGSHAGPSRVPSTDPSPAASAVPGQDTSDEAADPERLAPAALWGAGLLAALVLASAARHRRRRRRLADGVTDDRAAARLERALRVAQQPLDVQRLEHALRALAAGLAATSGPLPDIAGVLVTDGTVELLLTAPCPGAPSPWRERGDRWILPAGEPLPPVTATLAPLPALVAVGSQPGRHLLLDLERLGHLRVYGDRARAADLIRYLAAELACNSWSDTVELLLAGFDPDDAEALAELGPQRVRVLRSAAEGTTLVRQRADATRAALHHTGCADTLAGRVHRLAGDPWMPRILLVAAGDGSGPDGTAAGHGRTRCAAAAVTVDPGEPRDGEWYVTATEGGAVHVRLPFLHTCLTAAGLSASELRAMATAVRTARTGAPPKPPAGGAPPEATVTADTPPAATSAPATAAPATAALSADSPSTAAPVASPPAIAPPATAPAADTHLDEDLRAWHADDPGRPRVGVLGPVQIRADGVPPEQRRRLHEELVVYLAQRGPAGADAATVSQALWPDGGDTATVTPLLVARARQWLGTDPGGNPWLADLGADLTYRLAEGYLLDWHLFRRLRARAEIRGEDGAGDLRAALRLVRGEPLAGAERPGGPGRRNPYPWLAESDIAPDHLVAAVVDTAHRLAELCLAAGDTDGVRWAVRQAWLADVERAYDQPWRDLMAAEHADGRHDALRAVLADLMEVRDAETTEDLAPDTYDLVRRLLPVLEARAAG